MPFFSEGIAQMNYEVVVEIAQAEPVAAVRAKVPITNIAQAWKPALDQVWTFLGANGGLRPGHNLFLYHHPARRDDRWTSTLVSKLRAFSIVREMSDASRRPLVRLQKLFMSILTIN
jgi:hypothetical protein